MAKSVSHPISTRDSNISPRVVGPRVDIGRGLIWDVIQILPCIVVFIIYLNFLIRIELTWFIKNCYAFKINQRRNNTNFDILKLKLNLRKNVLLKQIFSVLIEMIFV